MLREATTRGDNPLWGQVVARLVKMEMAANDLTYADLSERLKALGTFQTPNNLKTKINRGSFGAQLLLQLFIAMQVREISVEQARRIAKATERDALRHQR